MSIIHKAHTAHHSAHMVKHLWDHLPRLPKKSAVLAATLGFCFGGLGLWLYFRSWKDGAFSIMTFWIILLTVATLVPVVGAIPGWIVGSLFAAGWGVVRALGSGRALVPDATRHGGNASPAGTNTPPYPPPPGAPAPGYGAPPNGSLAERPNDFFLDELKRQHRR